MADRERKVIIIAPPKLREAFIVLLRSVPNMRILAAGTDVTTMLSPIDHEIPELVLIHVSCCGEDQREDQVSCHQVDLARAAWADAQHIVLVKDSRMQAEALANGADVVLLEGVTATRLLEAINPPGNDEADEFAGAERSARNDSLT